MNTFEIKNRFTGTVLYSGDGETLRDVVVAAVNSGADLRGADLDGANLCGADLYACADALDTGPVAWTQQDDEALEPDMQSAWISVQDRMPPDDTPVLVYVPGNEMLAFAIDQWQMQREAPLGWSSATIETGMGWGDHDYEDVSHWMPLTAPGHPLAMPAVPDDALRAENERLIAAIKSLAMPAQAQALRLPEPMTDEEVAALIDETEYLPTDHAVRYLVETGECRVKEANEYPFHCDDIRTLLDRLKAAEAENERLRAELAEAKRDADRHRWLGHDLPSLDRLDAAIERVLAEVDRLRTENERLREFERSAALTLPGVYYMDPPDGGDVSLLKQLQRMSIDAARYRLLRRKFAIISDGNGNAEFCPINLPRPTYIAPNTAIELDTALDRERLGMPPTPGVIRLDINDHIEHLSGDALDAAIAAAMGEEKRE